MNKDTFEEFQGQVVAYNRVFDKASPFTHEVLRDLAKFCRAHESTFHVNPRAHAVLEGRREVWLKIERMLNLSTEELYLLHKVKAYKPEDSK